MNEVLKVRIGKTEQIGHASAVLEQGEELLLEGEGFAFRISFGEKTGEGPSVSRDFGETEVSFILRGFDIHFGGITWSSEVIGISDDGREVFIRAFVQSVIS